MLLLLSCIIDGDVYCVQNTTHMASSFCPLLKVVKHQAMQRIQSIHVCFTFMLQCIWNLSPSHVRGVKGSTRTVAQDPISSPLHSSRRTTRRELCAAISSRQRKLVESGQSLTTLIQSHRQIGRSSLYVPLFSNLHVEGCHKTL